MQRSKKTIQVKNIEYQCRLVLNEFFLTELIFSAMVLLGKSLLALAIIFAPLRLTYANNRLLDSEIVYETADKTLPTALRDIQTLLNIPVSGNEQFLGEIMVSGTFSANTGADFLNDFTEKYELDWTMHLGIIEITPRNQRQEKLYSFKDERQLEEFLIQVEEAGIEGSIYPPVVDPQSSTVTYFAPTVFLSILDNIKAQFEKTFSHASTTTSALSSSTSTTASVRRGVMVFRLQNAWASDKSLSSPATEFTIPGVATLLNQIISGSSSSLNSTSKTQTSLQTSSLPKLTDLSENQQKNTAQESSTNNNDNSSASTQSERPVISYDVRLNAVLIYDYLDRHPYYLDVIRSLDQPVKMVELEAAIIDIDKDKVDEIGINWRLNQSNGEYSFGKIGNQIPSGEGVIGIGIHSSGDSARFLAGLKALESIGESRVVSRPSVLTFDNQEATIDASERFYIKVEAESDASLFPVSTGTMLRVTPHIIEQNKNNSPKVQMLISIQDGDIQNEETDQIGNLPRIRQNNLNTQAVVNDGDTLFIGGHFRNIKTSSLSEVPILSQVPVLGMLFKSERDLDREFMRIFMIRPTIREQGQDIAPLGTEKQPTEFPADEIIQKKNMTKIPSLNELSEKEIKESLEVLADTNRLKLEADDPALISIEKRETDFSSSSPNAPSQLSQDDLKKPIKTLSVIGKYIVQVAALENSAKALQLADSIRAQGLYSYTETVIRGDGKSLTRVRVGYFASTSEAQATQQRLTAMGFPKTHIALAE